MNHYLQGNVENSQCICSKTKTAVGAFFSITETKMNLADHTRIKDSLS